MPSNLDIKKEEFNLYEIPYANIDIKAQNVISKELLSLSIFIGYKIDVNPKIPNTLKILEPTTLPTATSFNPFIVALKLTANSGKLVPIPTISAPIINSGILNLFAIDTEPLTNKLAP